MDLDPHTKKDQRKNDSAPQAESITAGEQFQERVTQAINRVFRIEGVTWGGVRQKELAIFRGRLLSEDISAAYDRLAAELNPLGITPFFRKENGQHVIKLAKGVIEVKKSRSWINLVLFILTLLSLLFTGGMMALETQPETDWQLVVEAVKNMPNGWPFAVSIIAILGAHEFGHYLVGRRHGLNVTLPYFIPLPFSPFGTMGAFINMRDIPKNKRVLLDVGVAGPFAGLLVTIPVLLLGLKLSALDTLPLAASQEVSLQMEGNSLLYLLSKYAVFGQFLPEPVSFGGLPKLFYWIRYYFSGLPFPFGGTDVILHPVAWAGWAGLLVTGLNLIPAGQLDGGHVFYVLFGKKWAQRVYPFILIGLVGLGFFWQGWWLWAFLLFLFGRVYAEPLDDITPLDTRRKVLAVLALVVFVLTFTPVPLMLI